MPATVVNPMSVPAHLRALALIALWLLAGSTDTRAQNTSREGSRQAESPFALETIRLLNGSLSTPARRSGMRPALATSERLLLQRRAALVQQLIAQHPEEVRGVALQPEVEAALIAGDPAIAPLLEREVSATGELTRQVADDFDGRTHTDLLQLHVMAKAGADLRVYSVARLMGQRSEHRHVTLTGIALGDLVAAETVTPAPPLSTAETGRKGSRPHPNAAGTESGGLTCSPVGEQKVAVLMLGFPGNSPAFTSTYAATSYWQAVMTGPRTSVNDYWTALSYGKTTASADVYNSIQLNQNYSCQDYLNLRTAALQAAAATVDLSKYNRIVLAFPASTCSYGGLADVGCNAADTLVNHPYSVVWLPILSRYGPNVEVWGGLSHELGHNLGLNHANSLDFGSLSLGPIDFQSTNPGTVNGTGAVSATGAVTAVDTEYGDAFSTMGDPWIGGPYSADHRTHQLGWIASYGSGAGAATVTTAGRYTLQAAEGSTGLRALRILRDDISSSWLWVEFHQPDNSYTSANLLLVQGENATAGATVHYENGYGDPDKTWQLDMARGSPGRATSQAGSFAEGALLPGATWSDPYSPLRIAVDSMTTSGLVVDVGYDTPCASIHVPSDPMAAAGASGTATVNAPPGCAWSAFSNAAWLTLTGSTTGAGDGSFGWTATANPAVTQRTTYLSVGRQSTRLLQLGNGANAVSLSPQNGSAAPGASTVFTLNLSTPAGIASMGQVALDITGAGADPCTVVIDGGGTAPTLYLYNRTEDAYSTALPAGSAGTLSIPGCTLSGARSGLTVSGTAAQFTLDLSFPADQPGVRSFFASAGFSDPLPVGLFYAGVSSPPPPPPPASITSTTVLNVSPTTTAAGSPVNLTAQVTGSGSTLPPTGSVAFNEGSTTLGVAAITASGTANLAFSAFAPGAHTVVAVYSGDSTFPGSSSAAATVTVDRRTALLTVSLSSARAFANAPVQLAFSVTAPGSVGALPGSGGALPTPVGTINVKDGATDLGTATIASASGSAILVLPALPPGNHIFTAVYSGDAFDNATTVTSPTLLVLDFTLIATGAPLTIHAGATLNNTSSALLTPGNGGFPANVSFTCSGAPARSTCTVTPGAVLPGNSTIPLTVTIQTTAPAQRTVTWTAQAQRPGLQTAIKQPPEAPAARAGRRTLLTLAAMPLIGLLAVRRRIPMSRRMRLHLLLIALAVATGGISGCGSGGTLIGTASPPDTGGLTPGTPTGTYTLTVTGTANDAGATLSHSVSLQLEID